MSENPPNLPWLRPLLILALCAAVFNVLWGETLIFRDSFLLYAPIKAMVAEGWKHFSVVGWNPHQYLGMPLMADVLTGYFYPPNIIYLLLPLPYSHTWFILLHYPLAWWFMDMFLRGRGVSSSAALAGGAAFALSGYMISQHDNLVFLIGPAWAPLAFHFFAGAIEGNSLRRAVFAGAVIAVQVLAGDPQSAMITGYLIAGGAAVHLVLARSARPPSYAALAGVFAVALCAMQVLPGIELMRQSVRAGGLDLERAAMMSYHPGAMLDLLIPAPFGALYPDYHYYASFTLDTNINNPWAITDYLGPLVLSLAAAGAAIGKGRLRIGAAAAVLVFLFLAFGWHTPVFAIFHRFLPLFSLFRFPAKYMAWVSMAVAVLAGIGFDRVLELMATRARAMARAGMLYIAAISTITTLGYIFLSPIMDLIMRTAEDHKLESFARSHLQLSFAHFAAAGIAGGIFLLLAGRLSVRARGAAAALIIVIDLASANVPTMPRGPASMMTEVPAAKVMIGKAAGKDPEPFRIHHLEMLYRDVTPGREKLAGLARQIAWERDALFPLHDAAAGFDNVGGYTAVTIPRGHEILENPGPLALVAFNTRYLIGQYGTMPPEITGIRTIDSSRPHDLKLMELPDALPRAYFVSSAVTAGSHEQAIALIHEKDLRKTAVISEETSPIPTPLGGEGMLVPARIMSYQPDRVAIDVEAPLDGWLVLSDRFYPGWSATVDGKATEIHRANVVVRAVEVPMGKHEVIFTYRQNGLRTGAMISAPAWILVIGLIFLRRDWSARRASRP